ncbi:MAG: AMMECR1 domain-containing protein [Acidobacteria bacterium]|nr:AMMECR1 domain-containing protein [Acidobacteriota bacterium]
MIDDLTKRRLLDVARAAVRAQVLGHPLPVAPVDLVLVGAGVFVSLHHGRRLEQGWRTGLLLPQVAVEHGWDRDGFLAHTCLKANLPRDAWRKGASVYRFEADAFAEPGPGDERLHGGHR